MTNFTHFKGKNALAHLGDARAKGASFKAETHGTEIQGSLACFADSLKEAALYLLVLWTLLEGLEMTGMSLWILSFFSIALILWKGGRSAWLGFSKLERLHRLIEQERWEIEHHRPQEREELKEMYEAKGITGKLLEEVVDVLMADGDRLLKVMLIEELGLSLEVYEHPLKQALSSFLGVLLGAILIIPTLFVPYGVLGSSLIVIGLSSSLFATRQGNRILPSVIWNISLALLSTGALYFTLQLFL